MIKFIKNHKVVAGSVSAIILCIILFVFGTIFAAKAKANKEMEKVTSSINSEVVSTTSSQMPITSPKAETDSNTDTDTESDSDVIKPIDCHEDFWSVKHGIAECYDHIFKKGHLNGTEYHEGECDKHDAVEINELARKVKLYRGDDGSYSAILPEIDWSIIIYDEKIHEIIDAQIDGDGPAYPFNQVSIVMYYSATDNTIMIETYDNE